MHFNLVVAKDDPRLAYGGLETALREWVFTVAVEEFGGSFSAEHAIGRKNQNFYERYTPAKIREFAARLKAITSLGPLTFWRLRGHHRCKNRKTPEKNNDEDRRRETGNCKPPG